MPSFLKTFFRSHWFKTLFAVIVVSILIWIFGPLIAIGQAHPFDSEIGRLIAIGILLLCWLIANILTTISHNNKEKHLAEAVAAPDPDAAASAEEVAVLSTRLKDALARLKKMPGGKRGKRRLYDLPWYIFIGPPGAGKTTALVNSGLKFPLADASGPAALRGVGGTRDCEWWFTDEAVLIDTAGRYTTQDSHAKVDSAGWLGFLKLLKKNRSRQPLNGALLAIGLPDLAALSEADRLAHAGAMRKRLRELQDELGVRVPIYVLFTKTDLISGFVEYFDNLGKEEREQVWGMTLPMDDGTGDGGAVAAFAPEFDLLLNRLNDRLMERVSLETDVTRRRLIYGFPQQIASLRDVAGDFLTEIFRPSRLEERPLLRGVYFTSGTQDGTPIDRLLGVMAGQFGLARQAVAAATSGAGRSYFLTRVMRDVVFAEASLVSFDKRVERRTMWTYRGAYAAALLVLLIAVVGWTFSYIGNNGIIDDARAASKQYNAQFAEILKRGPTDPDLRAVVPALDTLRGMRRGYDQRDAETPLSLTFGLFQGEKITAAAIDAYYRALNTLLLPRLLARIEGQLQANLTRTDYLYAALKVYLVLGRQGPLDHDQVLSWLVQDLGTLFTEDEAEIRDALLYHVDALLQRDLTPVAVNGPLIEQVRGILTRVPLAEYSYARIIRSPRVAALPNWTVADNAGAGAGRVFVLRSNRPLTSGVAGIYTWSGYHNTFLPLLPTVTKDISEDSWVLGREKRGLTETLADVNRLRRDVVGLYLEDYVAKWDQMLGDITVKPFTSVNEAVEQLGLISGPNSPLRNILNALAVQTQLSRAGATDNAEAQLAKKASQVGQRAAGLGQMMGRAGLTVTQNEVASILGEAFGTAGGAAPVDPASRVDAHFRNLHRFVLPPDKDKPAPMEGAIDKMATIYQSMIQVSNAPNQGQALLGLAGGGAGGGGSTAAAAQQLRDLARDLPGPVAAMLTSVSTSSAAVATGGASQALQTSWKTKVLPLCDEAFFNRYPFVAGSTSDVPTDDFAKLLGPGGMIDAFFNENLKSFVDTSVRPWKWQAANQSQLQLQPGTLVQLERAAQIRDSLFADPQTILVKFQLVPVSLDAGIGQITLDIAGQTMTYAHGPTESNQFRWPAPNGKTLVRATMTPASGGNATVLEMDGPWALLRMLDSIKVIPSGQPDKFRLVFSAPGGTASFDLNASSVRNPFTMGALRAFRCPAAL